MSCTAFTLAYHPIQKHHQHRQPDEVNAGSAEQAGFVTETKGPREKSFASKTTALYKLSYKC
jgi:hypothetical protein